MKDDAFTSRQLEILEEAPFLRLAFQGTAIDKEFKQLVRNDPELSHYHITEQGDGDQI